ncbi:MAG: hypothetical protein U1G07_03760 [Verrucomicrobiota bacterium]
MEVVDKSHWLIRLRPALFLAAWLSIDQTLWSQLAPHDPLQQWDLVYPARPALGQIVAGKDMFVGAPASGAGAPWVSYDGITWTRGDVRFDLWGAGFTGIGYGDGAFFGATATGEVFWSRDGINWAGLSFSPVSDAIRYRDVKVAAGIGLIVTASNEGQVAASSDGVTWTFPQSIPGSPQRLLFGNGVFVIVSSLGDSGQSVIYTSVDGVDWRSQRHEMGGTVWDVTFSDGLFTAVTPHGELLASLNASDWIERGRIPVGDGFGRAFTFGGGRFVGVIEVPEEEPLVVTSSDGIQWSSQLLLPTPEGFVYAGGRFVAFGEDIITSPDGLIWTDRPVDSAALPSSVAFGNGRFVAVGATMTLISLNGMDWTRYVNPINGRLPVGVYFANGRFIGPSWPSYDSGGNPELGHILMSTDGVTWTEYEGPPVLSSLRSIVYGNGVYVAIGNGMSLYSSPDGITWTKQADTQFLTKVLFGNGMFLASTFNYNSRNVPPWESYVYGSTDGTTWAQLPAVYVGPLMTFGNGLFIEEILASFDRYILASNDGIIWTTGFTGSNLGFVSPGYAAYGAGHFVLLSPYEVTSSPDGRVWSERPIVAPLPVAEQSAHPGLAFGNGVFVTVVRGMIQASRPVQPAYLVSVVAEPTSTSILTDPAAKFTFTRVGTAALAIELKVTFKVTGSAVPGHDYVAIPETVTIPAGQSSVSVPVVLIPNPLNTGTITVDVNLLAAENYLVGASPSARISIEPAGEVAQFGRGDVLRSSDGSVRLAINSPPGAVFQLEVSTDLATWSPLTNLVSATGLLEFIDLGTTNTHRFYRARPSTPTSVEPASLPTSTP